MLYCIAGNYFLATNVSSYLHTNLSCIDFYFYYFVSEMEKFLKSTSISSTEQDIMETNIVKNTL